MIKANSIQIYYSAHIENLVNALNKNILNYYQSHQDPLKPLNVIVPNGHIQKYLTKRLTEINGISANMAFPFLESGLFEALVSLLPANETQLLTIADMELAILAFLCDETNQKNTDLSPLFNYLETNQNPQLLAQKRWQLSQQLALLFIDYELSRPEMIQAWLSHKSYFENSHNNRLNEIEKAQAILYRTLLSKTDHKVTLSGLLRRIDVMQPNDKQPVFLFVPSRLSPLHRQTILILARYYPLHIYHFNVCREFWLDMETNEELNWRNKIRKLSLTATDKDGRLISTSNDLNSQQLTGECFFNLEQGLDEFENPLLKAWGKPGRETLRLLSDLENDAIHAGISYQDVLLDEILDVPIRTPCSTLNALQQAILNRVPGSDDRQSTLTNSILVASAPSIEVEVNQVYNSILYELKRDPDLKLTDIVILVTDMKTYRYVIERVFNRLNQHVVSPLRYSISDSSAGEESLYARAVTQLLNILETNFIRDEVFVLLNNPCVMTALNSHQNEVDAWLQTAVDLGVFRGFEQLYDGPNEDINQLYTWRQGLQRLHRSLAQSTVANNPLSSEQTGRLSVALTQLNEYKSQLNQSHSASQWQKILQSIFDTFIAVPEDHPQEETVALSVAQFLQELVDNQSQLILSYDDIKQIMLSRVSKISAGRGRYLSGGVVCAALQPMRPVPFKVSYILGLNESRFPGQIRQNTLDLAAYSRRIGDIDQVDNNKYLFLETLMSTQDKLFLSFVGRDEQSGDQLAPSVVVDDIMAWVTRYTPNALNPVPLSLASADNFKQQAHNNHSFNQNHQFLDYLLYRRQHNPNEFLSEAELSHLTDHQKSELNQFNDLFKVGQSNDSEPIKPISNQRIPVNIQDLSDYLINPTEHIFRQQGGILQRIEDTELLSDEPITINPLDKHKLFNQAVESDLQFLPVDIKSESSQADNLSGFLDDEYNGFLRQSRVPIKLFAAVEPLKDMADNVEYKSLRSNIQDKTLIPWRGHLMIGQTYSQQAVLKKIPAYQLNSTENTSFELSSTISHLLNNHNHQITGKVITRAGKYNKNKSLELMIKAFLEWCIMSLHDDLDVAEDYCVWLIFQDKVMTYDLHRHLVDNKIIKDYLGYLSQLCVAANNDYVPLKLRSDLSVKISKDESELAHRLYNFSDKIYFAFQELPSHVSEQLQQNYQQAVMSAGEIPKSFGGTNTIQYDEIKSILHYPPSNNILHDYRMRFMLFFAVLDQIDTRSLS
ncbi:exodeoxyribonuclease V subunit gamma [Marinicella gelatinilytica]|uniref:exodeoxyribonuclease V subunit gamma n=1 Tax=Marinicella gelatinilytica TaxID=2996017 RepID=UPI002260F456|nr:exodeoxyribonuclease V subunit gamma [Marinicella gelatinilytica]MCX7543911.1 exodeoxyribonuclease V subunit gamma [Marinicella gelatinilytica]